MENSQNLQKTVVNLFSKLQDKLQENEDILNKSLREDTVTRIVENLLSKLLDIIEKNS